MMKFSWCEVNAPEWCWDGVLELQPSRWSVHLQRHGLYGSVVELDPCDVVGIGAEPEGSGVGNDLLFVDPVANAVVYCSRYA